jgi:hypothetical protein
MKDTSYLPNRRPRPQKRAKAMLTLLGLKGVSILAWNVDFRLRIMALMTASTALQGTGSGKHSCAHARPMLLRPHGPELAELYKKSMGSGGDLGDRGPVIVLVFKFGFSWPM